MRLFIVQINKTLVWQLLKYHITYINFCVITDAPTCRQERILVVGASRAESLDISCEVEADPPARRYKWKFNNSGETLEVAQERFAKTSNGTISILRYTPVSDLDYGTLSCWAFNSIGQQLLPCVFQVVAAGKFCNTRLPSIFLIYISQNIILFLSELYPNNPMH